MAKRIKAEHPPLCIVVWDDAWSAGIELLTMKDVEEKHRPSVMQSIGWVLKQDEKGLWLASERCLDQGEECYRGHTFIPNQLIKSVTPHEKTPRRTRRPVRVEQLSREHTAPDQGLSPLGGEVGDSSK